MSSDELLKMVDEQIRRYINNINWLAVIQLSGDQQLIRQCKFLGTMKNIIIRCIQVGNYRRACRYLLVFKRILDNLENSTQSVQDQITEKLF